MIGKNVSEGEIPNLGARDVLTNILEHVLKIYAI